MKEIRYKKKKNKKLIAAGVLLGAVLLALLVVFGLFHIQEVVVEGNEHYTSQEIQDMILDEPMCTNSIYLMWKYSHDTEAGSRFPFLNDVEVEMISPFKIKIRVYEKIELGYLKNGEKYAYFDKDGTIVENSTELHENVPLVTGASPKGLTLYQKMEFEDEKQLKALLGVAVHLSKNELIPDEIRFGEDQKITLVFGKIRVYLGANQYVEEKISHLKAIFPNLSDLEGGLHMENFTDATNTVTFKKGEKDPAETESRKAGEEKPEGESEGESESESEIETSPQKKFVEDPNAFSTDAEGNKIYTDPLGNTTDRTDSYNYVDDNGEIIMDGYGYIDPYTGAYIN